MPTLSGTARNIAFAHNDWVEKSATVLSGDTWEDELPLDNLKTLKLSEIARSKAPNALTPSILVDFGSSLRPPVSGILIPKHNLSETARWRFRLGPDAGMPPATTAYDTRPVLGTTITYATLAAAAPVTYTVPVEVNISFSPGMSILLAAVADPGVTLTAGVVSYDHLTRLLRFNVTSKTGSGVHTAWVVTRQDADIRVWPEVRKIGSGTWADDYTWGGILAVGPNYRPPAVHLIPLHTGSADPIYQRYGRLDLADPENPAGHVDLSKLVIAAVWQPRHNVQPGFTLEPVDTSPRVRSSGGTLYVDARQMYRRLTVTLAEMSKEEAYSQAFELQARLGVSRPCIVVVEPDDPINLHRLTLYGSLIKTAEVRYDHLDSYSVTLTFEEWT
jgi:hypothetical protein